jgi:hypothetical protein
MPLLFKRRSPLLGNSMSFLKTPLSERSEPPLRAWMLASIVLSVLAVLYVCIVPLNGSDFWLQAKIGEIIVSSHAIPDTVLFPFTEVASEKFNAHEWLTSIFFQYLLASIGESSMPLLIGFLGLVLFAQMSYLAYGRGNFSLPVAILCGLIAIAAENYRHVLRPELISLVLMGGFWIFLEKFRQRPCLKMGICVMFFLVLWVNSHGSFVLGPIIISLYVAGTYINEVKTSGFLYWKPSLSTLQLSMLGVASCACCLLNPFGFELVRFAIGFGGANNLHTLPGEWMPTFDSRVFTLRGFWIGVATWVFVLLALLLRKNSWDAIDVLVFMAFSFLAFKAIRFPVYLGMVAAFVIPPSVPLLWSSKAIQTRLFQLCCLLSSVGLAAAILYGNAYRSSPYVDVTGTKFSDAMARAISNPAVQGNVLNSMELGPELIYRAYPRLKPSSDVRLDSYGLDYLTFQETLFYNDALLVEFVNRYDVRYVLVNLRTFGEFQKLASWTSGNWRVLLMDSRAVLLQRRDMGT